MSDIKWKYAAHPHTGMNISIEDANKQKKRDYKCLDCGGAMVPKKGIIRRHHFSHKSDSDRDSCGGEGARHWTAKLSLAAFLSETKELRGTSIDDVRVEVRDGSGLVPDITVEYRLNHSKNEMRKVHIEIVDLNPPSERKKEEFDGKMIVLTINEMDDDYINEKHFFGEFFGLWLDHQSKPKKRSNSKKCSAITKAGNPCKNYPLKNKDLCSYHKPRKPENWRRRAYIFRFDMKCWSCEEDTPVIHAFSPPTNILHSEFDEKWLGNYEVTMNDDYRLGSRIAEIYPWVRYTYSHTQKRKTHSNHCLQCEKMQGNFYVEKAAFLRRARGEPPMMINEVDYISNYVIEEHLEDNS